MQKNQHETALSYHLKEKHFWWDALVIISLWPLGIFLPENLVFSIFELKVIVKIIAIVATLEMIAFFAFHLFRKKSNFLVQGILGGIVSSTATFIRFTSKDYSNSQFQSQLPVGLVCTTIAMLIECLLIILNLMHSNQLRFIYPILVQIIFFTCYVVFQIFIHREEEKVQSHISIDIDDPVIWKNVFKLSLVVIGLIVAIDICNKYLSQGTHFAVFFISMLEAHAVLAASLMTKQSDERTMQQILLILFGQSLSKEFLVLRSKNKFLIKKMTWLFLIGFLLSLLVYKWPFLPS